MNTPAIEKDILALAAADMLLVLEFGKRILLAQALRGRHADPREDRGPFVIGIGCRDNRELSAGHLLQVLRERLSRIRIDRLCIVRENDAVVCLPVERQRYSPIHRRGVDSGQTADCDQSRRVSGHVHPSSILFCSPYFPTA